LLTGADLDDIGRAVTRRKLNDTQSIPVRIETHSFGVDSYRPFVGGKIGQVASV
jgi:hypothetical protein